MGREVQQSDDSVIDKALNDIRNVRFAMNKFHVKNIDLFFFVEISDQIRYFWQKTKLTEVDTRLRFFVASLAEGKETTDQNKITRIFLCVEAFGSIFVDTVCLPFGSSVNTFGKSRCDLDMLLTFEDFREKCKDSIDGFRPLVINIFFQQIKHDGKIPQLRFLTKRSYLNDRFQAQAYLKVSFHSITYPENKEGFSERMKFKSCEK